MQCGSFISTWLKQFIKQLVPHTCAAVGSRSREQGQQGAGSKYMEQLCYSIVAAYLPFTIFKLFHFRPMY